MRVRACPDRSLVVRAIKKQVDDFAAVGSGDRLDEQSGQSRRRPQDGRDQSGIGRLDNRRSGL